MSAGPWRDPPPLTPKQAALCKRLRSASGYWLALGALVLVACVGAAVVTAVREPEILGRALWAMVLPAAALLIGWLLRCWANRVGGPPAADMVEPYGDQPVTEEMARHAEAEATCGRNWAYCADLWADLQSPDEVRRCLLRMETYAAKSGHWLECAREWDMLLHDQHAVARCLESAEEACDTAIMWTMCAVSWRKLLGDEPAPSAATPRPQSVSPLIARETRDDKATVGRLI